MDTQRRLRGIAVLLAITALAACGGGDGGPSAGTVSSPAAAPPPAAATLTRTAAEPAGANCFAGGTGTQSGADANGNGLLDDSEVDATGYTCNKYWRTASVLETDDRGFATDAQVAFDANGNALAIWAQDFGPGTARSIWSSRYTAATGWRVPVPVETGDIGDAGAPQIAFDGTGNALAVWHRESGSRVEIRASRYTVAGWGVPVAIESVDTGIASSPQIAVDTEGNALAVWTHNAGQDSIWANRYTAGVGWGSAEPIETNPEAADSPQIAFDAGGNALAVWAQSDGTRSNIWSNRYATGAGWGTPVLIEADDAGGAFNPQIAADTAGNALAVWWQFDGTRYDVWSNRYADGAGWGTAELIETGSEDAAAPDIAFDTAGNALAVWRQKPDARSPVAVMASRYTGSTGWGSAIPITNQDADNSTSQQIAVNGSGNAVAVWMQFTGTDYRVWSSSYTTGRGWGPAVFIEGDEAQRAEAPQVAIDADGNAIAVWQRRTDSNLPSIWANVFK